MSDPWAETFAAAHVSFAKVRARMPRAAKHHTGYGGDVAEPPEVTPRPPVVVHEPHVDAPSLAVGDVATCTMGIWNGVPTDYAYQWLRNSLQIFGALTSEYTFAIDDQGAMIGCRVDASNTAGSAVAVSNEVGPITA
jgi:hypothetical protein